MYNFYKRMDFSLVLIQRVDLSPLETSMPCRKLWIHYVPHLLPADRGKDWQMDRLSRRSYNVNSTYMMGIYSDLIRFSFFFNFSTMEMDGPTDQWMDKLSYRDASKNDINIGCFFFLNSTFFFIFITSKPMLSSYQLVYL